MVPSRKPTPPGDILYHDLMEPMNLSQVDVANMTQMSRRRINEIINDVRDITPDTAIRLGLAFGMSPEFWLNLQTRYTLWKTQNDKELQKEYKKIRRIKAA